jgi:hypothetical protein
MTKDKANGKLMGGRIRERRIRKRGLDLESNGFFFCWKEKEKPKEGKRKQNLGEEDG